MRTEPPDHYATLDVAPDAGTDEVRAAYLAVMRACHPDVRPGDLAAAERARRANLAWQVLRNPVSRAAYDRQRAATAGGLDACSRQASVSAREPSQAAYAERRKAYGRTFHAATLKVAAAVFAAGFGVLILVSR